MQSRPPADHSLAKEKYSKQLHLESFDYCDDEPTEGTHVSVELDLKGSGNTWLLNNICVFLIPSFPPIGHSIGACSYVFGPIPSFVQNMHMRHNSLFVAFVQSR